MAAASVMTAPQAIATVKPCTTPVVALALRWAARYPPVAAAAIVLSSAAPIDEPNWLAALVAAPAAPPSDGRTSRSAVPRAVGPATPVPRPR